MDMLRILETQTEIIKRQSDVINELFKVLAQQEAAGDLKQISEEADLITEMKHQIE